MANIHEYLTWRGDVPFSVSPFNEVDGLVLAELAYADFKGVLGENERVTVEEVRRRFWTLHTREEIMASDSYTKSAPFLMDGMADQARFGGTELAYYFDVLDTQADIQLAALAFYLPDSTVYVAFRGTDDTVVGWKEDFLLSYLPETEGQRRAVEYMNGHFLTEPLPLRVGGHSKGGNLAVYASACAAPEIRRRIIAVYNNDGPGFLEAFTQTENYRELLPRIISTVPEQAVIGTLLSTGEARHIVKSTARGIVQHDGFSWQVMGSRFVEAEKRSDSSLFLETTVGQWLREQSMETRRIFVTTLFGLLESTGHDTISDIRGDLPNALANMWKMLEAMPKEQRDVSWNMLTELISIGSGRALESMAQETRKGFTAWLGGALANHPMVSSLIGGRLEQEKNQEPTET